MSPVPFGLDGLSEGMKMDFEYIKQQLPGMQDDYLLQCLSAGVGSYQPGVYELYLKEAERRGLTIPEIKDAAGKEKRHPGSGKITRLFVFSLVLHSVRLLRHCFKIKPLAPDDLQNVMRYWKLSIGSVFTTAVIIIAIGMGMPISIEFGLG
jgi:hypothetical protein